jgi:uncharacterized membrane protein YhdT
MEGYGRWLALAIVIAAVIVWIVERRRDKNSSLCTVLEAFFYCSIVSLCILFIALFW